MEIKKDWCMDAARREGDSEVGAGLLALDPVPTEQEQEMLKEIREILRSCYQVAGRGGVQTRWPELTTRIGDGIGIVNRLLNE